MQELNVCGSREWNFMKSICRNLKCYGYFCPVQESWYFKVFLAENQLENIQDVCLSKWDLLSHIHHIINTEII